MSENQSNEIAGPIKLTFGSICVAKNNPLKHNWQIGVGIKLDC